MKASSSSHIGRLGTKVSILICLLHVIPSNAMAYPSLTESGRWRVDLKANVKYKLPLDFYVKLDFTLNYDNQPADEAGETDYVLQLGFGWSL